MDPYEILGVSRNADKETIRKAYRSLVKKYHPDKYVNDPLEDIASEKLKRINEAYDIIMKEQTDKKTQSRAYSSPGYTAGQRQNRRTSTGGGTYSGGERREASFRTVRTYIISLRLDEAENMLSSLPRTAEWYYLMGLIYKKKGWYDKAESYMEYAVRMDPENEEYRASYNIMHGTGDENYQPGYGNIFSNIMCGETDSRGWCGEVLSRNYSPYRNDLCCCLSMIMSDCLCQLCSGDFFSVLFRR